MMKRIGFGLMWVAFVAYAFLGAPPDQPDTLSLIQRLATGDWQGINPWIVTLFNLMGVWPLVLGAVLLRDGCGQRLRAGLFWAASFGVGVFAILPYLALRQPQPAAIAASSRLLRIIESRWVSGLAFLGGLGLIGYGIVNHSPGDWADFAQQWQQRRFIHVMSLDFCLLTLTYPVLLRADMARRGWGDRGGLLLVFSAVPLLGGALYGILRPALVQFDSEGEPVDSPPGAASSYSA